MLGSTPMRKRNDARRCCVEARHLIGPKNGSDCRAQTINRHDINAVAGFVVASCAAHRLLLVSFLSFCLEFDAGPLGPDHPRAAPSASPRARRRRCGRGRRAGRSAAGVRLPPTYKCRHGGDLSHGGRQKPMPDLDAAAIVA
jgi:hypothetical protein